MATYERISQKVFEDGSVLGLEVRYWRGRETLKADDMGLEPGDVADEFTLGRKDLVPRGAIKIFGEIEKRARKQLEMRSHDFPLTRARYVAARALGRVIQELEQAKRTFEQAAADFVNRYPSLIESMRPAIRRAGEIAAANAGVGDIGPFLDRYEREALDLYPPQDAVRATFKFDWQIVSVDRPNLKHLSDTDAKALALATEKAQELYADKFEKQITSFIEETAARVRTKVAEFCARAKRYIQSERAIPLKTLAGFREQILALGEGSSFLGDQEVEDALKQLDTVVSGLVGEAQVGPSDGVCDLLDATEKSLSDLTRISELTGEYMQIVQTDLAPPRGGEAAGGPGPEGHAPEGHAPEGHAPEGHAPEGHAPEGQTSEGQTPNASDASTDVKSWQSAPAALNPTEEDSCSATS